METENSEGYKITHEGAEVYLNGGYLGNGEIAHEVETPYEEVRSGGWGPEVLARPTKRTFKITMMEGSRPLREDWIIKRYAQDGSIKEATFSGQEEAQMVMQLFRDLGLEGHFELVCRPRAEDVVVTSYRNEPEEKPLSKPEGGGGFDREKAYRDDSGDIWTYRSNPSDGYPGWYFQEEEEGSHYGPFSYPLAGPHEEVEYKKGLIREPGDLLKGKHYRDSDGCVWGFRIHQDGGGPAWHWRLEGSSSWDPRQFPSPVDGPWTEYKE